MQPRVFIIPTSFRRTPRARARAAIYPFVTHKKALRSILNSIKNVFYEFLRYRFSVCKRSKTTSGCRAARRGRKKNSEDSAAHIPRTANVYSYLECFHRTLLPSPTSLFYLLLYSLDLAPYSCVSLTLYLAAFLLFPSSCTTASSSLLPTPRIETRSPGPVPLSLSWPRLIRH